jgi:hypothetical protein
VIRCRPGDQPLPLPGSGPSMHDLVCDDIVARWGGLTVTDAGVVIASLQARKRLGLERYGEPLRAGNGRDAARDLREEIEDAVVYCRQLIEEGQFPEPGEDWSELAVMYDALIAMLFKASDLERARAGNRGGWRAGCGVPRHAGESGDMTGL